MATPQIDLLEQLSRDKLFSIYQFLLLESHDLSELSRSSSKEEMISALGQVMTQEEALYCVEFFENYEFYDVPGMKWEMLDALPDELLLTLHTIYLDDYMMVDEHRELVNRLSQSPYFLKEDARKFYLWYHYFRKRITLDQIDPVPIDPFQIDPFQSGLSMETPMETQRVDLQEDRGMPMFTMESHGDILGHVDTQDSTLDQAPDTPLSTMGGETTAVPAPKRTEPTPVPAPPVLAPPGSDAPSDATASYGALPERPYTDETLNKVMEKSDWMGVGVPQDSPGDVVNRTIEITAFDLDEYVKEREAAIAADKAAKEEDGEVTQVPSSGGALKPPVVEELDLTNPRRVTAPTVVADSFIEVMQQIRDGEDKLPPGSPIPQAEVAPSAADVVQPVVNELPPPPRFSTTSDDSPSARETQEFETPVEEAFQVEATNQSARRIEQATMVIDSVELAKAFENVEALRAESEELEVAEVGAVAPFPPVVEEPVQAVEDEPFPLGDEDMLADSMSLDLSDIEPVELDELDDADVAELDDSDVAELGDSDVAEPDEVVELEPLEEDDQLLDESALIEEGDDGQAEGEPLHSMAWMNTEILSEDRRKKGPANGAPPPPPKRPVQEPEAAPSPESVEEDKPFTPPSPSQTKLPAAPADATLSSGTLKAALGAPVLPLEQLDDVTQLLYRISLIGAPYGRTQIRTIRLYMQRILGTNPAQLLRVRDKLKELQSQDIQRVAPPLAGVADWAPNLSYGMRLHLLHSAVFLLGVKTINTLDRFQDFLVDLAAELSISPDDVDLFGLFNIGREDIQLEIKDCLEMFDLELGATEAEIRKSHRNLAKRYHPDKFHSLGPEFRRMAEHKMKEANMALEILLYRADRNL